jgi:cyclic pyranopterin phosphate synthase
MIRTNLLIDSQGRILRDLRVSVTDRCNFRCLYCLPETEAAQNFYRGRWANLPHSTPIARQWQPRAHILTFEEIERVVRLAVGLGIQKVRLTGGEPLLRQEIEWLVERLAAIPGVADLAMTTNGFLFLQKARALRQAGLRRVSFSLDSLDRANFKKMTGRDGLEEVLASIALAKEMDLEPVKVNAVIIRGINDHEIEALAEFGRRHELSMRFIEFMPLDSARLWLKELVVPAKEILRRLQARYSFEAPEANRRFSSPLPLALQVGRASPSAPPEKEEKAEEEKRGKGDGQRLSLPSSPFPLFSFSPFPSATEASSAVPGLRPVASDNPSETAKRWAFTDGRGEVGIIAPVSEPFCGHCNRLRLTADGKIRTCLFSVVEHDLRSRLREGADDEELRNFLQEVVWQKEPGHRIGQPDFVPPSRSMSCIGG